MQNRSCGRAGGTHVSLQSPVLQHLAPTGEGLFSFPPSLSLYPISFPYCGGKARSQLKNQRAKSQNHKAQPSCPETTPLAPLTKEASPPPMRDTCPRSLPQPFSPPPSLTNTTDFLPALASDGHHLHDHNLYPTPGQWRTRAEYSLLRTARKTGAVNDNNHSSGSCCRQTRHPLLPPAPPLSTSCPRL